MMLWIQHGVIHPMTGAAPFAADIQIEDGRILKLVPPDAHPANASVLDAAGLHIWPGFLDPRTHVGLTEEHPERPDPSDTAFAQAAAAGVTAIAVCPAPSVPAPRKCSFWQTGRVPEPINAPETLIYPMEGMTEAKCRIGHIVEAQVLQAIEIDYIDESEVLSPADDVYHIDKTQFDVPFVCGARDLGEALRRVAEGATMIRTKGEPGTGDVVQAVRHMRKIQKQIRDVVALRDDELFEAAKQLQVPVELVREVHATGKLPVVNFAAGGVATPADAALMMQLGAEGVFVGSGIFKSGDPAKRAAAIVKAVANFTDAKLIAELSEDLGEAMVGINADEIEIIMEERGR